MAGFFPIETTISRFYGKGLYIETKSFLLHKADIVFRSSVSHQLIPWFGHITE